MKFVYWIVGILVLLGASVFGLQLLASERVEVVQLHTLDANGEEVTTRLWVADDDGYPYLRVGSGSSAWSERLFDQDEFELTRQGERARYTAVARPDKRDRINQLLHDKYTWGDSVIGVMVGSWDSAVPLELHRQP